MLEKLGVTLPIVQAPMAGIATPALAAAVSNAGGLGSIGVGATDATGARKMIEELRAATDRAFNVNVFVHVAAKTDTTCERAWLDFLKPHFAEFGVEPPKALRAPYTSFADDADMLDLLLETKPAVVSFHFGLPSNEKIRALKNAGITLLATATSLDEARQIEAAGVDGLVAQGIEAGGHRGVFDPDAPDEGFGTFALTRLLVRKTRLPVIAAGGIMDGAGIAAALDLGAQAAQLGTAFVCCPESAADEGYRQALASPSAYRTRLTALISGRPARALDNRFTALQETTLNVSPPAYPVAYHAGKALHTAAKAKGEHGFGAHWAGQGAPLSRSLPAGELMSALVRELNQTHAHDR
ncbi:nitronate monooxygenase [bacterium M00.F.Ca.ET.194.01.1.1]|nr:nitronate monooxygenase [bacterium M00.F.Ca.ET.194.01.1.1]TGS52176.1 nitronate monooxygenase [bacterium M00.F.Ca.ET.179.01.1.1]TGV43324.1 nitronate monooxygenase [bacterium M00.F.Ca.ET.168.01.1.1]